MNTITFSINKNDNYIVKTVNFNNIELYFKFPKSEENFLTNRIDPFIYALVFPMMEIGGDFYFDGDVSKSVLDNLEMFCKIWEIWCPDLYKPITIHANEIKDEYRPDNKKMISAFSGGLDAAYTAYKYKNNLAGRKKYDLEKSVMIHGADIPLQDKEQFKIAFNNAKKMTDDLEIALVSVETNFREVFDCNWEHCFGAFMVAVLNFFSKYFSTCAASDSSIETYITKWGMNPITDPFLSSNNFKFIADGYEHNRTQRAGMIKNWKAGLDNLRVCWRNDDKSQNCGYCEKCVRTKLNLLVNGISTINSMPWQFSITDLDKLPQLHGVHLNLFEEVLNYAVESNLDNKELIEQLSAFINKQKQEVDFSKSKPIIKTPKRKLNFLQNIFSITNEYKNNTKRKVITVIGIKFKVKVS